MGPVFAFLSLACSPSDAPPPPLEPGNERSFVVLELFTSEGCSSCPPADRELNRVVAERAGEPVFPVAWHVSYWDGLGWPDPYGDERFDRRQRLYSEQLDSHTYTPQLVVQGQEHFPGSRGDRVDVATVDWVAEPGELDVQIVAVSLDGDSVTVELSVHPEPAGADLQVVLLESGLSVDVERGENADRTLEHDNVARAWVTLSANATSAQLPVPAGLVPENASVLVMVQDRASMAMLGAAQHGGLR